MKKLTAKQRREIYLQAAMLLEGRHTKTYFLCGLLRDVKNELTGEWTHVLYSTGQGLDEFDLFSPTKKEYDREYEGKLCHPYGNSCCWWAIDGDNETLQRGIDIRTTCMLLCAEMCNS